MRAVLDKLKQLGFAITLKGTDSVSISFKGIGKPDLKIARRLIDDLKAYKTEVIALLAEEAHEQNESVKSHEEFVKEALELFPGSKLLPTPLVELLGEPESKTARQWRQLKDDVQRPWGDRWWTDAPALERAKWNYANACVRFLESKGSVGKEVWAHIVKTMTWEDKHNILGYFKTLKEWDDDKETSQ